MLALEWTSPPDLHTPLTDSATSPVATAVVVGCRNKVWPSKLSTPSLVMMVAGIGLCIDQHGSQSDGYLLCIMVACCGVICAGVMLSCSSALMVADSVDPVALTCYDAPWSAMALAPFALVMDICNLTVDPCVLPLSTGRDTGSVNGTKRGADSDQQQQC